MRATFFSNKGTHLYSVSPSGFLHIELVVTENVPVYEEETDVVFNTGEYVEIPSLDKRLQIEKVVRLINGDSEYYLNHFAELDDNMSERNKALAEADEILDRQRVLYKSRRWYEFWKRK